MEIYISIDDPVGSALKKVVLELLAPEALPCDNPDEADLIIVGDKKKLQELFDEEKFFAVVSMKEVNGLPANACWIYVLDFIPPMVKYLKHIEEKISKKAARLEKNIEERVETGKEFQPTTVSEKSQHILVVDDKSENRQLAIKLLNGEHFVTLAPSFGEGLKLVRKNRYDVVLTDCQMLPETEGTALSVENIAIGQTVHNGIFMLFHATKRGAKVAMVTDGNHHQDWVSSLLDDQSLRAPQEVNGQPVLLINYMGKEWDRALKALNEL